MNCADNTVLIVVCHWFACVWGLQASFDPLNAWPGEQGFCELWGSGTEQTVADYGRLDCPADRVCEPGVCASGRNCTGASVCFGPWPMYMECLYTAAGTMTSGGAFSPAFANTGEKALATIMILLSGVLWSQLIGVLCGIAANLSPAQQAFRKELSELNDFMSSNPGLLDRKTRFRLREYLHQSVHMKRAQTQKRILAQLSPALHSEVVWKVTEQLLVNVRFLRDVEKELLVALAFHVNAKVFPPEEICPQGVLYIIDKGIALYAGKVLRSGDSWGEDLLMRDPSWVGHGHGIALHYLWVYTLEGRVIKDCLALYPESERVVRKVNMRWMIARMMIKASNVVRVFQRSEEGEPGTKAAPLAPVQILKQANSEANRRDKMYRWSMDMSGEERDGVEAAKRFAAREAVRQAETGTEADRITKLQTEVVALRKLIEERLPAPVAPPSLVGSSLPPSRARSPPTAADAEASLPPSQSLSPPAETGLVTLWFGGNMATSKRGGSDVLGPLQV